MEGLGVDLIEISRIRRSIANPRFLARVFTIEEIEEYERRGRRPEILAAGFCAKEAFAKAAGSGFRGFSPREVALVRAENGKPSLRFSGFALELAERENISCMVSVSHTKEYAVAVVTLKGNQA